MPLILADEEWAVAVVAIVAAVWTAIYFIVKTASSNHRRTRLATLQADAAENEARLKALMIQRGMSAAEIEQVLASGAVPKTNFVEVDEHQDAEARIVRVLSDNGYNGDAVQSILKAARVNGRIDPAAAQLVTTLAENWAKAGDIERVLRSRPVPADPDLV